MGNNETFEFLIYGLRVCSIILIVLGGILFAFDFLDAVTTIRNRKSLEKMERNNNRSGFGAGFLLGRWIK